MGSAAKSLVERSMVWISAAGSANGGSCNRDGPNPGQGMRAAWNTGCWAGAAWSTAAETPATGAGI
eukprot:6559453-Lingulodinium_polyedra.AAC.1